MKSLTLEAYKILYYITGSEKLSYYAAVLLLSVLHVIVVMGIVMLLDGFVKTKPLLWLFRFPVNMGVGAAIAGINLLVTPPSITGVADNIHVRYHGIIVYTLLAGVIMVYKLFFAV